MKMGGQHHAPAALPPGKPRCVLYRRLGGPQGRSGQVRKISLPPGFDTRTDQPLVSRYTDYAIPAHYTHTHTRTHTHTHTHTATSLVLRHFPTLHGASFAPSRSLSLGYLCFRYLVPVTAYMPKNSFL